jgi:deoxyribonuclease V
MRIKQLHEWNVSIADARKLQETLAPRVSLSGSLAQPRLICGVDVSVDRWKSGRAAAVILTYPEMKLVEKSVAKGKVDFPYVPGLLSFREIPLTIEACRQLRNRPDLVMVDGQGYAHPRRIGLASHIGLVLGISTIGCAKSHLCGDYLLPGSSRGSWTPLTSGEEEIGAVLRTRDGVKPLFISVGHKISLPQAIHWVLQCSKGFRLPEPTRLAHQASRGL